MKPQYIKVDEYGCKFYYSDKAMEVLHREGGPAIEWSGGDRFWCHNGVYHREDGPAIERVTGDNEWYINGVKLTEWKFKLRKDPYNGVMVRNSHYNPYTYKKYFSL